MEIIYSIIRPASIIYMRLIGINLNYTYIFALFIPNNLINK